MPMKTYATFGEWKKDQSAKNRKLVSALEGVVKATAPHLTKTVKWGQGCFVQDTAHKLYIHANDDHVQLGFYNGSALSDPGKLLAGNGKYVRHIKVRTPKDIDAPAFAKLIRQVLA